MQCPSCDAVLPAESRFCLTCGQPLAALSEEATVAAPPAAVAMVGPHARRLSSDAVHVGGFAPGVILADRYRIIGLLGRGGMGEVCRADDLKLGHPVALKFLPRALSNDPVQRERFFAEVRVTRQLSHPNMCRVYDADETNGQHFLSMEYIDGEDLASPIQRIGYLSNEKALEIARQLAAGLAAAHERGVLHRDLKPANVMRDGRGRVRITDFGLAVAVGDESRDVSGTPAHMAPEQLAGKGATVRSDIYALGLVLYELYTGTRAFNARTLAELREQKDTVTPRAPSELHPAYGGKAVWFDIILPSATPAREPGTARQAPAIGIVMIAILLTLTIGSLVFARRNVRQGRATGVAPRGWRSSISVSAPSPGCCASIMWERVGNCARSCSKRASSCSRRCSSGSNTWPSSRLFAVSGRSDR